VFHQLAHHRVLAITRSMAAAGASMTTVSRSGSCTQLAVVHRLAGQADAQVAAVALEHADAPAHHVVQQLVAAAQALGLAPRRGTAS
jgi:hypothetical protein